MKAKLSLPLRSTIRDGFDERDVARLWRGVRNRRPPRRLASVWAIGAVAVTAAILLVALPMLRSRLASHDRSGLLRLATGEIPGTVAAERGLQRWQLADGSEMVAAPHTTIDVVANDGKRFVTALRQGTVRVDVRPGGPRRWVVECGAVQVEVVGTEFEVERTPGEVVVSVMRGVVLVRGAEVPGHVQRLGAGQRLAVSSASPPGVSSRSPTSPAAASVAPTAPSPVAEAPAGPGATQGLLQARPEITAPVAVSDDLIRRADAARRAGDLALAKRLLRQAVERGHDGPSGAVAALTLARLSMSEDPAVAARVLAVALAASMPRGLEEDARARLVEARARSGDAEGARQAAREYHRRFPQGARRDDVRRWVGE